MGNEGDNNMANTIDMQVGIWDTVVRLINHRDGTASIKYPYIKWSNNSGNLDFKLVKIENLDDAKKLKDAFNNDVDLAKWMANESFLYATRW